MTHWGLHCQWHLTDMEGNTNFWGYFLLPEVILKTLFSQSYCDFNKLTLCSSVRLSPALGITDRPHNAKLHRVIILLAQDSCRYITSKKRTKSTLPQLFLFSIPNRILYVSDEYRFQYFLHHNVWNLWILYCFWPHKILQLCKSSLYSFSPQGNLDVSLLLSSCFFKLLVCQETWNRKPVVSTISRGDCCYSKFTIMESANWLLFWCAPRPETRILGRLMPGSDHTPCLQ